MHTAQEGVEVPPEEMEVPIGEEVDLALLESDEPEDLSYAAMFAHQLNIGKDSSQMPPQKAKESSQWKSAPTADPIVQPPSAGQVLLQPFRHHCNGITPMLPTPCQLCCCPEQALIYPFVPFCRSSLLQEASVCPCTAVACELPCQCRRPWGTMQRLLFFRMRRESRTPAGTMS